MHCLLSTRARVASFTLHSRLVDQALAAWIENENLRIVQDWLGNGERWTLLL